MFDKWITRPTSKPFADVLHLRLIRENTNSSISITRSLKMIINLIILCVIKIKFFLHKVEKVQMITLIDQRVSVWKSTFSFFFFSSKACLFKMNIFCILMLRKEIDRLSGRKVINYYSVDLWSLPTDIFSILKCVVIKHLFQW